MRAADGRFPFATAVLELCKALRRARSYVNNWGYRLFLGFFFRELTIVCLIARIVRLICSELVCWEGWVARCVGRYFKNLRSKLQHCRYFVRAWRMIDFGGDLLSGLLFPNKNYIWK